MSWQEEAVWRCKCSYSESDEIYFDGDGRSSSSTILTGIPMTQMTDIMSFFGYSLTLTITH